MSDDKAKWWNEAAVENAMRYIASSKENWGKKEFFISGNQDVERHIIPFLKQQAFDLSNKTVLDIGCGIGRVTRSLSDLFGQAYGIDFSIDTEDMMKETKNLTREKIRLLYLLNSFNVGGAEKAMARILSGLDKNKYDITVVALKKGSGRLLPELEKIGARIEIIGAKSKYDVVRVAFRLSNLIKNLDIQVLVCSLFRSTILGRFVGRLTKTPVIVNWEHTENPGGILRVLLEKITIPLSDKILCDSERTGMKLRKYLRNYQMKLRK